MSSQFPPKPSLPPPPSYTPLLPIPSAPGPPTTFPSASTSASASGPVLSPQGLGGPPNGARTLLDLREREPGLTLPPILPPIKVEGGQRFSGGLGSALVAAVGSATGIEQRQRQRQSQSQNESQEQRVVEGTKGSEKIVAGLLRGFTTSNEVVAPGTQATTATPAPAPAPIATTTSLVITNNANNENKSNGKKEERKADSKEGAPKKRRKVNHACIYCRRSHMTCDLERPCTRCVKRNIGHLCHDEKRASEKDKKKPTTASAAAPPSSSVSTAAPAESSVRRSQSPKEQQQQQPQHILPKSAGTGVDEGGPGAFGLGGNLLGLVGSGLSGESSGGSGTGTGTGGSGNGLNPFANISELFMGHNHFGDLATYPNNYLAGATEVNNEFNLLNDFLNTSMLDDKTALPDLTHPDPSTAAAASSITFTDLPVSGPTPQTAQPADLLNGFNRNNSSLSASSTSIPVGLPNRLDALGIQIHQIDRSMGPPPGPRSTSHHNHHHQHQQNQQQQSSHPSALPASLGPAIIANTPRDRDKAARDFYLQAADPTGGNTNPEERMQRLLKAKHEAGLLKPWNYVRGYQKLSAYLDSHIAPASKQKILRCLDRFRPKFREIAQGLTDVELVFVEMWFETQLLEYDRVFASMAVPACLWRRTGEIFRGNKEMAEILGVPVEKLRDGSIALHQIMTEDSMVRYWEEFETIAFDPDHDTLLTACAIKSPDKDSVAAATMNCAFSFMIHRDDYKMPTLIIGNFLPHDPMN